MLQGSGGLPSLWRLEAGTVAPLWVTAAAAGGSVCGSCWWEGLVWVPGLIGLLVEVWHRGLGCWSYGIGYGHRVDKGRCHWGGMSRSIRFATQGYRV